MTGYDTISVRFELLRLHKFVSKPGMTSIAFFVCPGSNLRHDFHGSINQLLQKQIA